MTMMTFHPRWLAAGLVLVAATAAAATAAVAQSADLALCDRIAADPSDPDKPADIKGTAQIAAADIPTALKFCRTAAAGSRRAMYELGRAYAANNQPAEALATYRKAADKGSSSAMVELGVAYATGRAWPKTTPRRASCSNARRRPAIPAGSPICLRSVVARTP